MQFLDRLKAEGLSLARQAGYVQRLTTIAATLGKDFDKTNQQDIEQLIRAVNAKDWAEWTKDNYSVTVKRFWRWLRELPRGKDPPETEWIRIGKAESRTILPQDLLTKEETQKLIQAAEHPRDKAYVAVADESGARPGEVLTMKIRSVTFDEYGAVIVVRGKKGERRIRLVASAPYLAAWLDGQGVPVSIARIGKMRCVYQRTQPLLNLLHGDPLQIGQPRIRRSGSHVQSAMQLRQNADNKEPGTEQPHAASMKGLFFVVF